MQKLFHSKTHKSSLYFIIVKDILQVVLVKVDKVK